MGDDSVMAFKLAVDLMREKFQIQPRARANGLTLQPGGSRLVISFVHAEEATCLRHLTPDTTGPGRTPTSSIGRDILV
jgi:hypothetical protein